MATQPRICSSDLNELRKQYTEKFCKFCVDVFGPCPTEELIKLFREKHPECMSDRCVCGQDGG
ncbi:MAG: hypothetical protein ACWGQW_18255 [bacterium]